MYDKFVITVPQWFMTYECGNIGEKRQEKDTCVVKDLNSVIYGTSGSKY